jgi:hypothetical protein
MGRRCGVVIVEQDVKLNDGITQSSSLQATQNPRSTLIRVLAVLGMLEISKSHVEDILAMRAKWEKMTK